MNVFKIWKVLKKIKQFFFAKYASITFTKKIKSKIRDGQSKPLTKNQINEISKYYNSLGVKNVKPYWHQYFSGINGSYSKKYIPQDYFFSTISYALNQKAYRSLMDKNLLDKVFQNIKHPITVLKRINGFFHYKNIVIKRTDALNICKSYRKLLIKPSIYSGGGKNIIVFSINNGKTDFKSLSLEQLFDSFGKNFIIQEVVNQHKSLKLLNESSLNTLRIISYMPDENVNILSAYIRIGSKGSIVDNMSSGGIGCKINDDGKLSETGYYNKFEHQTLVTDSGTVLKGFIIPNYQAVIDKVKVLHMQVPYFKIVAWDIAIDENKDIVFIEFNLWEQAIDFAQIVNGPLFGDFTDEVIKISVKYNKNI